MNEKKFKKKVRQKLEKLDRDQVVQFAWRCGVRALPFLGSRCSFGYWNARARKKNLYFAFFALDISLVAATTNAAERNDINLYSIILQDLDSVRGKGEQGDQQLSTDMYGEVWDNFQKALADVGCAYWGRLYKDIFDSGFVLDEKTLEAVKRRVNVPEEIRKQGAAKVASHLEALEKQGGRRLNEARIIVLGDKGAGKTSIARKLINPDADMPTDKESTAGVDTMLWKLEQDNINVGIWDFAGHTVTHAVHQFFLSERCLYIMVYDGWAYRREKQTGVLVKPYEELRGRLQSNYPGQQA